MQTIMLNDLANEVHANAVEKGFWDEPREIGTLIALIHSEVSEALEASTDVEFCEELADICIRVLDLFGRVQKQGLTSLEKDLRSAFGLADTHNLPGILTVKTFEQWIQGNFYLSGAKVHEKYACLVHGQLSSALEYDRKSDNLFWVSLSMVLPIVFTWASDHGHKLGDSIVAKIKKNKTRPKMHGKKY